MPFWAVNHVDILDGYILRLEYREGNRAKERRVFGTIDI